MKNKIEITDHLLGLWFAVAFGIILEKLATQFEFPSIIVWFSLSLVIEGYIIYMAIQTRKKKK